LNLLRSLGALNFGIACFQVLRNSFRKKELNSFEDFARHTYGDLIAKRFLLDYSEKLWGVPASQLSLDVAGSRLKGLDIRTFILESLFGNKRKTRHLDGTFFYPKHGIGVIFDRIREQLPEMELASNSAVSRIFHEDGKITSVEINTKDVYVVDEVVCSLPLGIALKCLDPQPPQHIVEAADSIKFRDVLLLMFCIDKGGINDNASMYFSSSEDSFTRIYEPRNRSPFMAPHGKTSLAVEVPHFSDDLNDQYIETEFQTVQGKLVECGFFENDQVIAKHHLVLKNAYPVLTKNTQVKSRIVHDYLTKFENLTMTGRNGLVQYSHIHDHMENAFKCFEHLRK
jgi:protoporphyrinogen oxidase